MSYLILDGIGHFLLNQRPQILSLEYLASLKFKNNILSNKIYYQHLSINKLEILIKLSYFNLRIRYTQFNLF